MSRDLIERLREEARQTSEASRMLAQAKSRRQADNPTGEDIYTWLKPEETTAWQAADVIRRLVGASIALDKAIADFLDDLRTRASWDKMNVDDDGTVTLPCGNGVLYRLGEARGKVGDALASIPSTEGSKS